MNQTGDIRSISPQDLHRRYQNGEALEIIDVRFAYAYAEAHVPLARSVPFERLDPRAVMTARDGSKEDPLYVICQVGGRSREACERFIAAGFESVVNVDGGTDAWEVAGLPVVRKRGELGLRRQVQVVAGSLVVLGSAMSLLWHPLLVGVPALVGAGLIYTGATGSCAMGALLARMPWNRRASSVGQDVAYSALREGGG